MNQLNELLKYNYISISKGASETIFSKPYHLLNEGSFYRLAELHIINKENVEACVIDEKKAVITYYNGDVITLIRGQQPFQIIWIGQFWHPLLNSSRWKTPTQPYNEVA